DQCEEAQCQPGPGLSCDDGKPCTVDSCDHASGVCMNTPLEGCRCTDTAQCNNSNPCDGEESCQGGFCTPGTPLDCADENPCTDDTCDAVAGCRHVVPPTASAVCRANGGLDADACGGV